MTHWLEFIIVGVVVFSAAIYLVSVFVRRLRAPKPCGGGGGACGCKKTLTQGPSLRTR